MTNAAAATILGLVPVESIPRDPNHRHATKSWPLSIARLMPPPPHRRLPPLNWLRAFDSAARHMSFTEAAEELGVTQAAVSQQVRQLEDWLGTQLFKRLPRSLALT